jgi:hypothetical protein
MEAKEKRQFKVGDVITDGKTSVTITDVSDDAYIVTNDEIENDAYCVNWCVKFADQENWKFAYHNN